MEAAAEGVVEKTSDDNWILVSRRKRFPSRPQKLPSRTLKPPSKASNAKKSRKTTLLSLPDDILVKILEYLYDGNKPRNKDTGEPFENWEERFNEGGEVTTGLEMLKTIGRTCRRFRRLCLSCPTLWGDDSLVMLATPKHIYSLITRVSCSKQITSVALTRRSVQKVSEKGPRQITDEAALTLCIGAVAEVLKRIQSINRLVLPSIEFNEHITNEFCNSLRSEAPFSVRIYPYTKSVKSFFSYTEPEKSLRVETMMKMLKNLKNLQELSASISIDQATSKSTLRAILSSFLNMTKLKLENAWKGYSSGDRVLDLAPLRESNLVHLALDGFRLDNLSALMSFPNLTELKLKVTERSADFDLSLLRELNLSRLELEGFNLDNWSMLMSLKSPEVLELKDCTPFLTFMGSGVRTVDIHSLIWHSRDRELSARISILKNTDQSTFNSILRTMVSSFPNLTKLKLKYDGSRWDSSQDAVLDLSLLMDLNLTHLGLEHFCLDNLSVLSCFPNLTKLKLKNYSYDCSRQVLDLSLLRELDLIHLDPYGFRLDNLSALASLKSLEVLKLRECEPFLPLGTPVPVPFIISDSGVRTMDIDYFPRTSFRIARCPRLEKLTISQNENLRVEDCVGLKRADFTDGKPVSIINCPQLTKLSVPGFCSVEQLPEMASLRDLCVWDWQTYESVPTDLLRGSALAKGLKKLRLTNLCERYYNVPPRRVWFDLFTGLKELYAPRPWSEEDEEREQEEGFVDPLIQKEEREIWKERGKRGQGGKGRGERSVRGGWGWERARRELQRDITFDFDQCL